MAGRKRIHPKRGGKSRTKPSLGSGTDINKMMAKYQATGNAEGFSTRGAARYGDFTSGLDYHAALTKVTEAKAAFMSLPSAIRDYVNQDHGELLDLVFNPARATKPETSGSFLQKTTTSPSQPPRLRVRRTPPAPRTHPRRRHRRIPSSSPLSATRPGDT